MRHKIRPKKKTITIILHTLKSKYPATMTTICHAIQMKILMCAHTIINILSGSFGLDLTQN